ncbi:uncharacterized protein LOC120077568 isoform X2 [Benincasa hispida]|uniref:uncharacterized protein LOC120077568 isoform X2 n=1 Tax=Benincasa hispida TaxID=102211 RepID=UPI001902AE85|nr:uncharacterized protein LOC120077568 isoform X2 [Benincasa hispida]
MNRKEILRDFLYTNVKRRNWAEVIKKCGEEIEALSMMLTQSKDTTLHLAAYDNNIEVVETLVRLICSSQREEIFKSKNERENTPLHVAAIMGCARMCHVIGSVNRKLVDERNIDGETPLFLAALYGHTKAFYCLYDFCKMDLNRARTNCRRKNGDTIIHRALKNERFDMAFQLINMNNEAATWVDTEGYTPLHVLATKPSAFKSGANIGLLQHIVYHLITSKPAWKKKKKKEEVNPCDYNNEAKGPDLEKDANEEIIRIHEPDIPLDTHLLKRSGCHESDTKPPSSIFPQNYDTCINFLQIFFSAIMIILGFGSAKIRKLREKKQKNRWSVQVMEKLLELAPPDKYGQNGDTPMILNVQSDETLPYIVRGDSIGFNEEGTDDLTKPDNKPKPNNVPENKVHNIAKETPMLLAAKNGVVEMVRRLFEHFPLAIRDSDPDKKNVVLLAAEYRQPDVYKFLLKKRNHLEPLFRAVDKNGDSALHLAARLKAHKTWRIKGAALQMQWEVKWYRYVRDSVEPHFFAQYNNKGIVAKSIFHTTHNELGKKGGEWLTSTSESCSLLAALVLTVAYASATTVPGGNGDDGTPPFRQETGFFIFSLASLIALCLSTTSVIMFLSILTSRFDEKDFGSKLPGRLFIGLSSLFLSIVAMLVSFCAGHYFLLSYRLPKVAVLIYIATSLPVALFFVMVQLPLFSDLLFVILSKTPKRSNDVILMDDSTLREVENPKNEEGDKKKTNYLKGDKVL